MADPNLAVPAVVTQFDENVWRIALAGRFLTTSPSLPGAEQIASAINEYVAPLLAEYRRRGEALERAAARIPCELGCYPICQHETVNKSLCCELRSRQALGGSDA